MEYQIAIYSGDAVFARMLELDFLMRGHLVLRAEQPQADVFSEIAILDLDTCPIPISDTYHRLIGFTCNSLLLTDEVRRQCSMILRRPFEMNLLRREVFSGELPAIQAQREELYLMQQAPQYPELTLNGMRLAVGERYFELTPTEAQVIELLLERRGEPVSREEISNRIGVSSANKADVYICYLRKKLEGQLPFRLIYTVRKRGYCIR